MLYLYPEQSRATERHFAARNVRTEDVSLYNTINL